MPSYQLVSGETIAYPTPTPAVAAFLERIHSTLVDAAASPSDLLALVYGTEVGGSGDALAQSQV